jgi:mono/diheme cytochrome c family protein
MKYPFWDAGIGYGLLMASISILHVFISHFAVGGGLYLVVAETLPRRRHDFPFLDYLQRLSKFFILLTLVTGALTGVAIWFIIGLLNPAATEALIHNFLWAWAAEWSFFVVEIAAAILYFYGWERLPAKSHLILGWIYFGAAWASLFIINGIISFMLTPGNWLRTGDFWDGFFNPTFWPMLFFRSGVCVLLAGIFALAVLSGRMEKTSRYRIVRFNTLWGLLGLGLAVPAFYWYWQAIPENITRLAIQWMPAPLLALHRAVQFSIVLLGFLLLYMAIPRIHNRVIALILLAAGIGGFGAFEWFRESIRKPYVIYGYMYGNGVALSEGAGMKGVGYLANMPFRTGQDGADLFRHTCGSCHTLNGYQALKPRFDGLDEGFIIAFIKGVHVARGNMPEFLGTDQERQLLADFLARQTDRRSISQIYQLQGRPLGQKVFQLRCGKCHALGGFRDPAAAFAGADVEVISGMLDAAESFSPVMPAFTGDASERKALIEFLLSPNLQGGAQ